MPEIRDARPDDADAVFELLDARSRDLFGTSEVERRYVVSELARTTNTHLVAVGGDHAVVGYAHLTSSNEVVHAADDAAVGDALFERLESVARARGAAELEAVVVDGDAPLGALVRRHGFEHEGDILRMWRRLGGEIDAPTVPAGIVIRPFVHADGERVQALLDEAYTAWDASYVPLPYDEWRAFMTEHEEFDAAMWFVAEHDGELVGCALHWKEHKRRGWLKDLAVRERERGTGLGTALVRHGFAAYAERGVERVGLKVESTNPTEAQRLYERLGFVTDRVYGIWRKSL